MQPWNLEVIDVWTRAGVLNGDRESSAVVTLAQLFGRRGGSICSVADNIVTGERFESRRRSRNRHQDSHRGSGRAAGDG